VLVTVVGTVAVVGSAALGLGSGYALATGDGAALARLGGATVMYVAPVLVFAGVVWLVYGLAPRWATAGWLALAYCTIVTLFGVLFRLPQWVKDVSPFSHVPLVPAQPFALTSVLGLVAAVIVAAGIVALGHRDLG
jgi:ABC-2 type transport system permease protein